ncbi:MAG: hypothetical protein Aurels2KO_51290 [Aureliella sp.]
MLYIAERDGVIVGFLHLARGPNESMEDLLTAPGTIAALCVIECEGDDEIAGNLLHHASEECKSLGATHCTYRPLLPGTAFYLGFGARGSMIGATAPEQRTCQWLQQADYSPLVPTNAWEVDLDAFELPIDRGLLQVRRNSTVNREVDEPMLPWLQACMLGHTEPVAFQLIDRREKRVVSEVLFWTVGSELQTSPVSSVWLWPPLLAEIDSDEFTRQLFLVGESLREFQEERIDTAIAVSAAHDTRQNEFFRRLGFSTSESGVVFEKRL